MVGHDDLGYTDIGEEVDWVDWDAKEAEAKAKAGKKGKKAGGASKGSKIVSAEPVAGAKERMQKMFQSAVVRAKPTVATKASKVDAAETDALLEDILGDLDTPSSMHTTPRSAPARRTPAASRQISISSSNVRRRKKLKGSSRRQPTETRRAQWQMRGMRTPPGPSKRATTTSSWRPSSERPRLPPSSR